MDAEKIIARLNWFYSLEMNQVELYSTQSKQTDDIYVRKALERVSEVEQGHVENISEAIRQMGGRLTVAGEKIAPLTGKAAGFLIGKANLMLMLKANIQLEEKAMKDYKDFILRVGDDDSLLDLLWSNLIDEDLHTAWFANKVKELEDIAQPR